VNVASENACLDCGADGNDFVRVHALVRLFTEEARWVNAQRIEASGGMLS
jgi:hypothetical protein